MFVGLEIPKRVVVAWTIVVVLLAGTVGATMVYSVSKLARLVGTHNSTIVENSEEAAPALKPVEKMHQRPDVVPPHAVNTNIMELRIQLDLCQIRLEELRNKRPRLPARPMTADETLALTKLDRSWDRKEDNVRQECLRLKMMAEREEEKHGVK